MTSDVYYLQFAAAFVRGSLPDLPEDLALPALGDLEESQLEQIYAIGREAGLRLHRYKRSAQLPRVRKILGTLQGLCPAELLDLGTGRGVFLWPLLDEFPSIQVTCVDMLEHRIADLETVSRGGLTQVQPLLSELTQLPFEDKRFSCTTMLEVLEHTVDPQAALREVCRVTQQHLLISVPSKPDDNPEHLHLFQPSQIEGWLLELGAKRVKVDGVLNHLVVIAFF
jgi:2-polyprenyl-3-methyl-5-hydroxy-6-metoxy-1,4-benzoquinol methylase